MEANAFTQNLQEVLAHFRGEYSRVLFLDRSRLLNLELAITVQVDQGIVCIGQTGWRAWRHHRLDDILVEINLSFLKKELTDGQSQPGASRAEADLFMAPVDVLGLL